MEHQLLLKCSTWHVSCGGSTGRSVELRIKSMEVESDEFDPAVEELEFAVRDEMKAFLMEVIKQRLNDGKRDGFKVCPYFRQLLKQQKYGSFYCIICDHMHGFLWYARWPRWRWCSTNLSHENWSSPVPLLDISQNRGGPGAMRIWRLPHGLMLKTKSDSLSFDSKRVHRLDSLFDDQRLPGISQAALSKGCQGSQVTKDRVFQGITTKRLSCTMRTMQLCAFLAFFSTTGCHWQLGWKWLRAVSEGCTVVEGEIEINVGNG